MGYGRLMAWLSIGVLVAAASCNKMDGNKVRTAGTPMPYGVFDHEPSEARKMALADLGPIWVTRTRIANMYDGKKCYVRRRDPATVGAATRDNTHPVVIRLGDRNGSRGVDTDRDGVSDAAEAAIGTNPNKLDTDGDGLPDGFELCGLGTSPLLADSNGNGKPDNLECNLDDPLSYADDDGDGFPNCQETAYWGTNPKAIDTDGDGFGDDLEYYLGTRFLEADADSDGDGYPDSYETANNFDPNQANSEDADADNDNVPDWLDEDSTVEAVPSDCGSAGTHT